MSPNANPDSTMYRKEALSSYESHFRPPGHRLMTMPRWVNRGFWIILVLAVCLPLYGGLGSMPVSIRGPALVMDSTDGQVLIRVELPNRYRGQVYAGMPMQLTLPSHSGTFELVVESIEPSPLAGSSAVFYVTSSLASQSQTSFTDAIGIAVLQAGSQRPLFFLRSNPSKGAD